MRASALFGVRWRLSIRLARAALLAGAAAGAAAQTTTLQLVPSTAAPHWGSSFTVDVMLQDRPTGSPVGYFDIDVVFDPTVLRFEGLALGDALGSIGAGQAINASLPPAAGLVNLAVLSLLPALPAQPLSATLGQLSFIAIGLGPAGLGIGFSALEGLGGAPLPHARIDAAVSVVPEPATAWLLAAGALALAARRSISRTVAGHGRRGVTGA